MTVNEGISHAAQPEVQGSPEINVFELAEYSDDMAEVLSQLMHDDLDPNFSAEASDQDRARLRKIIDSPYHTQIVAMSGERVVGAACMTEILETKTEMGYLGGFAVAKDLRGQGVADTIWQAMITWCTNQGDDAFELQTEPGEERAAARNFYEKQGAVVVKDTIVYKKTITPAQT